MDTAPLELGYARKNARISLAASLFALAAGLCFGLLKASDLAGWLVAAVFVAGGTFGVVQQSRRQRDRGVVLRIGPDGILDRRLGRHLIRWDQIIAIEARELRGRRPTRYLDLHLHEAAPLKPGWETAMWRLAGARGFPVVDEGLEGNFNQILLAAKRFADERRVPCYT